MSSSADLVPELINADQLAKLLAISKRKLYRMKSARKLPAEIKLEGSVRWSRAEICRWIADGCPQPKPK